MRVCFGRLVSMRRILVLCLSHIFSQTDYEKYMNLVRKARILKNFSPQWIFHKFGAQDFLNLGFCSIFFKFWHSVISFVKDYSVFAGHHTILSILDDLCSFRPFRLHSSEKDAEYQNNP